MQDEKDEDIKIIRLGDKLSNIRSLYNNYETEKENLLQFTYNKDTLTQYKYISCNSYKLFTLLTRKIRNYLVYY